MRFNKTSGLSDIRPGGNTRQPRLDELVEIQAYLKMERWLEVRFLRSITNIGTHWIRIKTKKGDIVTFGKPCRGWDANTELPDSTIECPYCRTFGNPAKTYYINAIIRHEQENKPKHKSRPTDQEKETGFKELDSRTFTPVKVLRVTPGLARRIQELSGLNKHRVRTRSGRTVEKYYSVDDDTRGCDVAIKYNPKAKGSEMYAVQIRQSTPLTEEEQDYLIWDIFDRIPSEPLDEAIENAERFAESSVDEAGDYINSTYKEEPAWKAKAEKAKEKGTNNTSYYDSEEESSDEGGSSGNYDEDPYDDNIDSNIDEEDSAIDPYDDYEESASPPKKRPKVRKANDISSSQKSKKAPSSKLKIRSSPKKKEAGFIDDEDVSLYEPVKKLKPNTTKLSFSDENEEPF